MRKTQFEVGQYYHIFNHSIEGRDLFLDQDDSARFLESLKEFNQKDTVGSLFNLKLEKNKSHKTEQREEIVSILAYALNQNHFHLLVKEKTEKGISQFMKKVCGGYAWYYNFKYKKRGSVGEGPFKAFLMYDESHLRSLSAYINLNHIIHGFTDFSDQVAKNIIRTSLPEYIGAGKNSLCDLIEIKNILNDFNNTEEYRNFCIEEVSLIKEARTNEVKQDFSDQVAKKID